MKPPHKEVLQGTPMMCNYNYVNDKISKVNMFTRKDNDIRHRSDELMRLIWSIILLLTTCKRRQKKSKSREDISDALEDDLYCTKCR
jgi:hypothetical protein